MYISGNKASLYIILTGLWVSVGVHIVIYYPELTSDSENVAEGSVVRTF